MKTLMSWRIRIMPDIDPDISYLEQDEFKDRLAAYRRNEFHFVGVRAEAEVAVNSVIQTIKSGGLWGIESDHADDYILNVAAQEHAELRKVLAEIGVTSDPATDEQIRRAVDAGWQS